MPDGPEEMVHICTLMNNHIISIYDIEGMAYLISIDIKKLYIVNNWIDMNT